jgi:hypothetical protein
MVGDPHPLDRERTSPNFLLRRLFGRRSREYDRQFFYPSLERGSLKDRGLVYLDCMYPRVIEGAPFPAVDKQSRFWGPNGLWGTDTSAIRSRPPKPKLRELDL